MEKTDLSIRVLRDHAADPNLLFYDVDALGSMFRDGDLQLLDRTYSELASSGHMQPSGTFISFFGSPKRLYKITPSGIELARAAG